MDTKNIDILRNWLSLLTFPVVALYWIGVLAPLLVVRKIWRWYRLPLEQRLAIRAKEREQFERRWEEVEVILKAELIAHGLPDTPANRARLNSARAWRRKR